METVIDTLVYDGWAINKHKVRHSDISTKILDVFRQLKEPRSQITLHEILNVSPFRDKTLMYPLIGMLAYLRHYIPYLQIIMKPLCGVTRKAADFQWGQECRKAFKRQCNLISEHGLWFRYMFITMEYH